MDTDKCAHLQILTLKRTHMYILYTDTCSCVCLHQIRSATVNKTKEDFRKPEKLSRSASHRGTEAIGVEFMSNGLR